jgi:anti-sigma B factor antagonist
VTAILDPPTGELVAISVSVSDSVASIVADGEIDANSAPQLREELDGLLASGVHELVVDLGGVTFLDSAGLCVLAATHRKAQGQGARLRVRASSRAVIRPMQITGLWDLLAAEQITPRTRAS